MGHCLRGRLTGPSPTLTSPAFDTEAFQVPIVELDVFYGGLAGRNPFEVVRGLRLYWSSDDSPEFSAERSVGAEFSVLPPDDYPWCYRPPFVTAEPARFSVYFPMFLHPDWGREGRRIRQLRVALAGPGCAGLTVDLNYLRATYDVRLSTSNANLIRATAAFALWSGDLEPVAELMPSLRRAMLFLLEHLRGRKEAVPCFAWVPGHDGLGGPEPGHGLIGRYWDLLPAGRFDLESSLLFREALLAMAELEDACARRGIAVPGVTVVGPDDRSTLAYHETPESLRALAERSRRRIERLFWVPKTGRFCRNVDAYGGKHDYGFLHSNVWALALGVGTPEQRASILSWLDGRAIEGDTSTGEDIYRWRFAPRTSTRRNETYYFWPWLEGMKEHAAIHEFGNQMQDGGAVPWTSLFELIARAQSGDPEQVDRAFARTLAIRDWFTDVKAAGGEATEFYRAYYNEHPERGRQQGGGPPGGPMDGGPPGGMMGGGPPGGPMGGGPPDGMMGGGPPGGPMGGGPPDGMMGGFGPMGGLGRGPGMGGAGSANLDPLYGLSDTRAALRARLLTVPALRTRYLQFMRRFAAEGLDWKTLGPEVASFRALIEKEVQAETRNLSTYSAFRRATAPTVDPSAAAAGRSIRAFAEARRSYLLSYTGNALGIGAQAASKPAPAASKGARK